MSQALRRLAQTGSKKDRAQFKNIMAETQPIIEYLEGREKVEAASTALEASREEFLELAKDKDAYLAAARKLFNEERFAPLWFTADEVRGACAKAGLANPCLMGDLDDKPILTAILQLADSGRRRHLSLSLLKHLPDYVAAGRLMDGWIVQLCAYDTLDDASHSNPFLFFMFAHGYDAWMDAENARDEEVLQSAGLDLKRRRGMNMGEIDAWLKAQADDPAQSAKMAAILERHPDLTARTTANLQQMEVDAYSLLEREDAREFCLTPKDIEPLTALLSRRWESWREQYPEVNLAGEPTETEKENFADLIYGVIREMAQSLFTPERVQDLITRLKKYRDEHFTAGDYAATQAAMGAIVSLERNESPADNRFLNLMCFRALRESPVDTGKAASANDH
jgi:hypothetical protein